MFISVHILYFSTFQFDHIILSKVKARKCPEILAFKVIISNHVFPLLGFKTKVVKVELGPTTCSVEASWGFNKIQDHNLLEKYNKIANVPYCEIWTWINCEIEISYISGRDKPVFLKNFLLVTKCWHYEWCLVVTLVEWEEHSWRANFLRHLTQYALAVIKSMYNKITRFELLLHSKSLRSKLAVILNDLYPFNVQVKQRHWTHLPRLFGHFIELYQ